VADILIPDVPEDVVAAIDLNAQRPGLSRSEYLRRVLARERQAQSGDVSTADLAGFTTAFAALDDPKVMRGAW
jgi:hypothetical protein